MREGLGVNGGESQDCTRAETLTSNGMRGGVRGRNIERDPVTPNVKY